MKHYRYLLSPPPISLFLFAVIAVVSAGVYAQDDAVGAVSLLTGRVDVIRGDQQPQPLALHDSIFAGDILQTQAEAELELEMNDGSSFTLDQNTRLVLSEYLTGQQAEGLFKLIRGRLRSFVSRAFSQRADSFQVDTKEGLMGVQGTVFDVYALPAETQVYVFEGLVSVTAHDPGFRQTRLIGAGEFTRIVPDAEVQPPRPFNPEHRRAPPRRQNSGLHSGASQDLRSGGRQSKDPTRRLPRRGPGPMPPTGNSMDDGGQTSGNQPGGDGRG